MRVHNSTAGTAHSTSHASRAAEDTPRLRASPRLERSTGSLCPDAALTMNALDTRSRSYSLSVLLHPCPGVPIITMAQQNFSISPPHAFCVSVTEPSMKWTEWKDYFTNYIEAIDEEGKMSGEQKKIILLHSLGPVGLKTYSRMQKSLPSGDGNVFSAALQDLDKYFAPKVCIGITRLHIFQLKQHKGEDVDDYVAELKKLTIDCKYGILHSDLIRDRLVMLAHNQSIQERLWINGDAPLEDFLAIIRKAEIFGRCVTE
ncbi:hypothetical protein NDU88_003234 [Pleurodeles waltl]|uniref:Retrotransposon gag domain-containing protein n=1 Tax=Pleurodeles waltl TaxID=8319 RepID=A0AAV7TPZ3_PLEWA|nr:hypothetical protein NDU88_003234 [Pleurodeles waltl]